MKNEVVVIELWVDSWLFIVDVVLKHVVDELTQWVFLFLNWWWELLLLLNICASMVNYWILIKWCFNLKFYASLSVFSSIWPVNIIWNEFWVGEDQNWDFWGKGVWNPKIFDWADECSLERALSERAQLILDTGRLSEIQANKPSWFWTEFAWASPKRAPSERAQNATGSWSLKPATLRLSEQHPVPQLLIFRFVHLGTNPNFLKCFFWLN